MSKPPPPPTEGLKKRALRGTLMTLTGFGGSNLLRLSSNMILTRILFPEAFGLMALVGVFMGGLQMFSDLGIKASIMQNERGDEPDFLNTAWTLQVVRGVVLWLGACALALPAATLYGEPMLASLLPIAGLSAVIAGCSSSNMATTSRHLILGRLTAMELGTQALGIVFTVALAWYLQSVWALVIGGLLSATTKTMLSHIVLPGIRNRLRWDLETARQLVRFGKYIFLSTIAGFLIGQSDRAVLGAYITTADLGIYTIGAMLGTLPLKLGQAAGSKVIFPLYRMRPPAESLQNQKKMFRVRRLVVFGALVLNAALAFGGVPLVDLLYDERYAKAGPILVLFSLAMVPQVICVGYTSALLSNGDSRRVFLVSLATAVAQLGLLFAGVIFYNIFGAVLAAGIATILTHPLRAAYVARYKAWDVKADIGFLVVGGLVNAVACWLYWDDIIALAN